MGLPILQSPPTKRGDESHPNPPTNLIYPHVFQRFFTESSDMELLPVRLKIATWEYSRNLENRKPGILVDFFRHVRRVRISGMTCTLTHRVWIDIGYQLSPSSPR